MKVNKLFSYSSILRIIYGTLILLPMFAIFGRVIYTQSNSNANLSYSGNTTTEYSLTLVQNENQLIFGNDYQISLIKDYAFTNDNYKRIYVNSTTFISAIGGFSQSQLDAVLNCDSFTSTYYNSISYLVFYDNQNTQLAVVSSSYKLTFKFNLRSYVIPNTINNFANAWDSTIYKYDYLHNYFMDNAFEYSIQSFVDDNNFAIDFFDWFDDLFLIQSNNHNAVYLNFANWYMNYSLLVTAGYFIFFVLMWIFTMLRRLMDRFLDRNYGGF